MTTFRIDQDKFVIIYAYIEDKLNFVIINRSNTIMFDRLGEQHICENTPEKIKKCVNDAFKTRNLSKEVIEDIIQKMTKV